MLVLTLTAVVVIVEVVLQADCVGCCFAAAPPPPTSPAVVELRGMDVDTVVEEGKDVIIASDVKYPGVNDAGTVTVAAARLSNTFDMAASP